MCAFDDAAIDLYLYVGMPESENWHIYDNCFGSGAVVHVSPSQEEQAMEEFAQCGNMLADPLFMDPVNGDFRLQSGSPCIDADGACTRLDFLGVVRPQGTACDIGPFEYGADDPASVYHDADTNHDGAIRLSELLRIIQFFNSGGLHCAEPADSTEDGFAPGFDAGAQGCAAHDSDYLSADWLINLTELLRIVQFFNLDGYTYCPGTGSEDGFCPGS